MANHYPWLSTLILFPWFAAAALFAIRDQRAARTWALGSSLVECALAFSALALFDKTSDKVQFVEQHAWIPSLEIDYLVGLDGLSVLFPAATAFLTTVVIAASWTRIQSMVRLYLALLLCLEGITIGIFCALDLALFFLFWELALVPYYFLISLWGEGPRRRYAATQYTLFMLIGGVPILFGIILLALGHANGSDLPIPSGLSFNYLTLLSKPADRDTQTLVFLLFLAGFAIKTPLVPLHTWLPTIAMEGPVGLTAFLTGLKLGAYGLLRIAIPLAPDAGRDFGPLLSGVGLVTVFYSALLALRQANFRRLLAYSSICHVGMVLVALSTLSLPGMQGAIFQLLNFAVVSGALFVIAGALHQRLGSNDRVHLGGLAGPMPLLTWFTLLFLLASLGLPGTNGFAAEWLMLLSIFESHPGLGIAALLSTALSAAYTLGYFRCAFLGPTLRPAVVQASDLRPRELVLLSILAVVTLVTGLVPTSVVSYTEASAIAWVKRLDGGPAEQPSLFANIARAEH